jgi:hypothetical protein
MLERWVWSATGNHCINMECMATLHCQREKQHQKDLDKVQKEEESKNKLLSQVRTVLSNDKPPDQLALGELSCPRIKSLCVYYAHKGDKAPSSHKNNLFEKYKETRHYRSLDYWLLSTRQLKIVGYFRKNDVLSLDVR